MEELLMAKTRYEELIERMNNDMAVAEKYKADLERYASTTVSGRLRTHAMRWRQSARSRAARHSTL